MYGRLLPELQQQLESPECKVSDLSFVMKAYLAAMEGCGSGAEADEAAIKWPSSPYAFSKLAVHYMSRLQQKLYDLDPERDILVNSVCPGFCDTDFTNGKGACTTRDDVDQFDHCFAVCLEVMILKIVIALVLQLSCHLSLILCHLLSIL